MAFHLFVFALSSESSSFSLFLALFPKSSSFLFVFLVLYTCFVSGEPIFLFVLLYLISFYFLPFIFSLVVRVVRNLGTLLDRVLFAAFRQRSFLRAEVMGPPSAHPELSLLSVFVPLLGSGLSLCPFISCSGHDILILTQCSVLLMVGGFSFPLHSRSLPCLPLVSRQRCPHRRCPRYHQSCLRSHQKVVPLLGVSLSVGSVCI